MMGKIRILLADDDLVFLRLTTDLLTNAGYDVVSAAKMEGCEQILRNEKVDVMMLDMCFPALQDGFNTLSYVHDAYPELPILMISGSAHIPDAVSAIKNGAMDFIEKPLDTNHLLMKLKRLSDGISIKAQMHELRIAAIGMRGTSAPMEALFGEIIKASQFDCPVLISGETGVGKELAAHAIHRLSKYGAQSLISINCASVPKDLFEAELFGYEKGAFTGADKVKKGYFEYAHNNSFFMDEISQLPISVQAKLLRVVAEGEVQKLGGRVSKIKTRIISASNQDLFGLCEEGSFRKDLLYRLNTMHIVIPPLRQRIDDIPGLADYFVSEFCSRNFLPPKTISSSAKAWMCEQRWDGNIRELKNVVERGVIYSKSDTLSVVDFTTPREAGFQDSKTSSLRSVLSSFEKAYIEHALIENEYNVRKTAEMLHMDKSNLFKKISSLGIKLKEHH